MNFPALMNAASKNLELASKKKEDVKKLMPRSPKVPAVRKIDKPKVDPDIIKKKIESPNDGKVGTNKPTPKTSKPEVTESSAMEGVTDYHMDLMRDTKRRVARLKSNDRPVPKLPDDKVDIRKKFAQSAKLKVQEERLQHKSSSHKSSKSSSSSSSSKKVVSNSATANDVKPKCATDMTKIRTASETTFFDTTPKDKANNSDSNSKVKVKLDSSSKSSKDKSSKDAIRASKDRLNSGKDKHGNLLPASQKKLNEAIKKKLKPVQHPNARPTSFADLLKLANQNKDKVADEKAEEVNLKNEPEGRPLTQEEIERKAHTSTKEYRDWLKYGNTKNTTGNKDRGNSQTGGNNSIESSKFYKSHKPDQSNSGMGSSKSLSSLNSRNTEPNRTDRMPSFNKKQMVDSTKTLGSNKLNTQPNNNNSRTTNNNSNSISRTDKPNVQSNQNRVQQGGKPTNSTGSNPRPSQKESSNPWDRIYGNIQANRPVKRKPSLEPSDPDDYDHEDEYDSEDEDFICDEDAGEDISSHIRDIFGYDKNKFKNESINDLRGMETNFREQMKEEARSLKQGKQEDLEDMRMEEAMLKAKMKQTKKMKR